MKLCEVPNYETLIRTEHQLGETYAPRAKHGQAKLVYIRNDSGHMFPNLVILVSTGKQEGLPGQGGQEIPKKSP